MNPTIEVEPRGRRPPRRAARHPRFSADFPLNNGCTSMPTATSTIGTLTRLAALGAALVLAGCGRTWGGHNPYVTVGGEVAGLSGTLVLQGSDGDSVSVGANGPFAFPLQIAYGSAYAVTVKTQPSGGTCTVTNGAGTANGTVTNIIVVCVSSPTLGGTVSGLTSGTLVLQNTGANPAFSAAPVATVSVSAPASQFIFPTDVTGGSAYSISVLTQPAGLTCSVSNGSGTANGAVGNVAVTCAPFALRPLPAVYATTKAVNYSPYRAAGPGLEMPTDAQISQDLTLLQTAGIGLLRTFGADSVTAEVLKVAAAQFPNLRFHLGIYLEGAPSTCIDAGNSAQIIEGITLAKQYAANVVAVSVGNETSFAANLPASCLAQYVTYVRDAVSQAVTADDDYTFYAGLSRSGEKPDVVLPLLDFVSLHTYPFSDYAAWNWQQTSVAAGPQRAAAMMNAALAQAQANFQAVSNYMYKGSGGSTVTIGASLPMTVGETGWKATETNGAALIENFAANPVNAKWYYDLLAGWGASTGGPKAIFYFEAFDEHWKGTDDGWGLWDATRTARYALCATPAAASPCNANIYQGAGYFQ